MAWMGGGLDGLGWAWTDGLGWAGLDGWMGLRHAEKTERLTEIGLGFTRSVGCLGCWDAGMLGCDASVAAWHDPFTWLGARRWREICQPTVGGECAGISYLMYLTAPIQAAHAVCGTSLSVDARMDTSMHAWTRFSR